MATGGNFKFGNVQIDRDLKFPDRTNWTGRTIRGSEKKAVIGLWIGAGAPLIIVFIWLAFMKAPLMMGKSIPNPVILLVGLFSLISLIRAIWETIRLRRFGDPVLELNVAPIPLGGTVEGRITIANATQTAPDFTVTLACIRQVVESSGKNSHTKETILWKDDKTASLLLGGILPISVAVPADQPQAKGSDPFDRILWRVTVKAPYRGQAFLEKYEIPVGSAPMDDAF